MKSPLNKQILSLAKHFIFAIIALFGVTAVFAAGSWTAPSATPPGNNTDAPINTGLNSQAKLGQLLINTDLSNPYVTGLQVFGRSIFNGNVQISTGTPSVGKVLTALDAQGTVGWMTMATPPTSSDDPSPLDSLVDRALIAYGENGLREPYAGNDARNWIKVIDNPYLVQGTKYGFIIMTGGDRNGSRLLGTGLGVDSGKKITSKCYNNAAAEWKTSATAMRFMEIPTTPSVYQQISYQGTFVYSTPTSYSNYVPIVPPTWGLFTHTSGATLNFLKIAERTADCSDSGKGSYVIYIYDYNTLKFVMDRLYAVTGNTKHKFNDPLSADTSLHNYDAWKY